MTKAKAPAFWSSIQDQIETDCAELREVFTDNVSRQCTFQRFDNRCELHSHNEERQIVILGLNIDALAISESAFKGSHSKRTEERSTLTLQVDSKDRLYLRRGTAIFTDVAEISEMLIKRACDLHD